MRLHDTRWRPSRREILAALGVFLWRDPLRALALRVRTLAGVGASRREDGDYNLEANAIVSAPLGSGIDAQVSTWFESLWNNHPGGIEYTADTDLYADPSQGRYWLYRFMEASGMCTF